MLKGKIRYRISRCHLGGGGMKRVARKGEIMWVVDGRKRKAKINVEVISVKYTQIGKNKG
jgi:hypothetical protein